MGVTYSVLFQNNSTDAGDVAVFQQDPNLGVPDVFPLAWFAEAAAPTTQILFTWTVDYSFVWSQTGQLVPGVQFYATQDWAADLSTSNQVTFSHNDSAYTFENQTEGPGTGSLYIRQDGSIPMKMASVGIGMSGAGTFAVQAQPNLNLTFTPHPAYYIAFGTFSPGQVLDIQSLTGIGDLFFPENIYSLTASLEGDNTWQIEPTQASNARIAAEYHKRRR